MCLVGIKEGFESCEGRWSTASITKLLQELLGINFHYLREQEVLYNAARSATLILHDKRVSIFPDYAVAKKGAAFTEAKHLLQRARMSSLVSGSPQCSASLNQLVRRGSLRTVVEYIKKNLKPKDTIN